MDGCRRVESKVWRTNCVVLRAVNEAEGFIYPFTEVRVVKNSCDIW